MTKEKIVEKLTKQLQIISTLKSGHNETPEFRKWRRDTSVALERIPERGTTYRKEFDSISFSDFCAVVPPNRVINNAKYYKNGLAKAATLLQSIIDEIEEYGVDNHPAVEINYEQKQQRLYQRLNELKQHWDTVSQKLVALEKSRILENRSDERLRLSQHIEETRTDRRQIEQEMIEIETQLQPIADHTELCKEEKEIVYAAFKCDGYQFDIITGHQNYKEPLIQLKITEYSTSNSTDVKRYYQAFQSLCDKRYIHQIAANNTAETYELTSEGITAAQKLEISRT